MIFIFETILIVIIHQSALIDFWEYFFERNSLNN